MECLIYLFAPNLETKNNLEKFNLKNVYFKGNLKLIDVIDDENIKNYNKKLLIKKDFGLLQVSTKKKIFFV